jgi:hypothetical protein
MTLMDDVHELPGADFFKFPVGIARNCHGQGRNGKACLPGLGGGIEGGGVGYDSNHKDSPLNFMFQQIHTF